MNKYDFCKIDNLQSYQNIYEDLIRKSQFRDKKKYSSINGYRCNYLFFIDDLNTNFNCDNNKIDLSSSNMELIRLIFETHCMYSHEDGLPTNFNDINFLFTSTYPGISN